MLRVTKCPQLETKPLPVQPAFGTHFSPHMLKMELSVGQNKFEAQIIPYEQDKLYPGTSALHYGQSIFEGMKAFRQQNGEVAIFRPDLHARRFRLSARRMALFEIPEEIFIECLNEYVSFEKDSVPSHEGHSLYLRPLLFASDNIIKIGNAQKFIFYIMSTLAGRYFSKANEIQPARVLVHPPFVRAYPGGTGEAKTAGNYAASLWPQKKAIEHKCDQVLYLDALHHDFVDELGGMNFFAIENGELVTPELNGCILHGVTRSSILELARTMGLKATEKKISFRQLRESISQGRTTELFACGTAAVIAPIGEIVYLENENTPPEIITLKQKPQIALELLQILEKIQRGQHPAPGSWLLKVK